MVIQILQKSQFQKHGAKVAVNVATVKTAVNAATQCV